MGASVPLILLRFLCAFLLVFNFAAASFAHEMRPAYLELREQKPGEFSVLWKTPMVGELRLSLAPEFSGGTQPATPVTTRTPPGASVQTWLLRAPALRGQTLRIRGLEATMTDALVRCEFADGTTWTQRLSPPQPSALIPKRQTAWAVCGVYLRLGAEHILSGFDHLLFVLALLLITAGKWRLVKTVTAFTIAHSITLALATLGVVHVPVRPVEAVIALSIVFVAGEIVRLHRNAGFVSLSSPGTSGERAGTRGDLSNDLLAPDSSSTGGEGELRAPSLTARAPWIVAFAFGLPHGLGFASALSGIGLPQGHIPLALLCFNLGVEAGQLLFIAAVLSVIVLGSRAAAKLSPSSFNPQPSTFMRLLPPYAIGGMAMFWVIQRVVSF